jgi:hypothetical protein
MDPVVAALVALCAFDAGIYAACARGVKGDLERVAEPVALAATAVGLGLALALTGKWSAVAALAVLFSRALFDTLHLGDGNVLEVPLPRDYPLYAMVAKAAAGVLVLTFAFPG